MYTQLILVCSVMLLGFVSSFKYLKLWQGYFTFFLLLILSICCCTYVSSQKIPSIMETVFHKIKQSDQFQSDLVDAASSLQCSKYIYNSIHFFWNRTSGNYGCHDRLIEEIGGLAPFVKPYLFLSILFTCLYFLFSLLFTIFIDENKNPNLLSDFSYKSTD